MDGLHTFAFAQPNLIMTDLDLSALWICSWQTANYPLWFWSLHIALAVRKKYRSDRLGVLNNYPQKNRKALDGSDDGWIFTVLLMLPHCWAMFVTINLRIHCATIATVLGMLLETWWAASFRLCSADLFVTESSLVFLLAGYAVDKLPTTLWFWIDFDTGIWPVLDI